MSTGDRTILGSISKRGNRYLRTLFVQAAWVVLVKIKPEGWERYGLKSWIEAAKQRLHRSALAIALANKLARIAWAVLHKGTRLRVRQDQCDSAPTCLILAPRSGPSRRGLETLAQVEKSSRRPALTAPARGAPLHPQAGTKERPPGTNKGTARSRRSSMK